jgi:predicted nucleic acid-binding Zn ribbon protein
MRSARPHAFGGAVRRVRETTAPDTPLAAVELEASPVSERDGVITVACHSATWAQELDLLGPQILERLNANLPRPVKALRFTADASRHDRH